MGLYENAVGAFQEVYNKHIETLEGHLLNVTAELEETRTMLSTVGTELLEARIENTRLTEARDQLLAQIDLLKKRIEELETAEDPGILPFWGAPVFRDEFDGDLSKWSVRNNALTFDTAKNMAANVTIEDGILHIRGKWLDTPLKEGKQGIVTHTTGYLDTIGKFSQQYGRWEIRCKMPAGANTRGALGAFWLRSDSHAGEIDIIERWGQGGVMTKDYDPYVKDTGWTTFHSNTNGSSASDYVKTFLRHYQHGIPKDSEDTWHTYAFEYMPDYIALYVDDKLVKKILPTDKDPENTSTKKRANGQLVNPDGTYAWLWNKNYFGSPFNIRMNLHVGPGAQYWGNPDPNNRALTKDPLDYQVDYVRVYAMPGA